MRCCYLATPQEDPACAAAQLQGCPSEYSDNARNGISTWPAVEPCFPSYSRKPGAKSWFERVEFGVARSTRCKLWPTLAVDGSHRCVLETGARPEPTTNPSCQQNHSSFRHHLLPPPPPHHTTSILHSLAHSPALSFAAFASPGLCDNHIEHSLTASPASPDSLRRLCLPEDKRAFHNNPRARLSGA